MIPVTRQAFWIRIPAHVYIYQGSNYDSVAFFGLVSLSACGEGGFLRMRR